MSIEKCREEIDSINNNNLDNTNEELLLKEYDKLKDKLQNMVKALCSAPE